MLIAQAEQQRLLLEEKTKLAVAAAVQEVKNQSEEAQREAVRQAEERIAGELAEQHEKELEKLRDELEQERKKTIWQRIFWK